MGEDTGDPHVASRHRPVQGWQQPKPPRTFAGGLNIVMSHLHGRIYGHVATFRMAAKHNRRRSFR